MVITYWGFVFLPVICLYVYLLTILHKILMGAFVKILWGRNAQVLRSCWRRYWSRCKYGLPCTALSHVCTPCLFLFILAIKLSGNMSVILSPFICYNILILKVKESPSQAILALRTALISHSVALSLKLQDHGHGASVLHGVPVYSPHYANTKLYSLGTASVNDLPKVALASRSSLCIVCFSKKVICCHNL